MKKLLTIWSLCLGMTGSLFAQDIHFSQYFNMPVSFQPAATGFFNGNYRLAANYRYQWPFANPQNAFNYHTQAFSNDYAFLEKKLKYDWMGMGYTFINDVAGSGRLSTRMLSLSVAYHKGFDRDKRYVLSAGIQAAYVNKSIDFSKLYYNNQWVTGNGFDLTLPNNEPIRTDQLHQLDVSAGMQMSMRIKSDKVLQFGVSAQHLNRPRNTFFTTEYRVERKYMAQIGFTWEGKNRIGLQAGAYFQYQAKAMSWLPSVLFKVHPGGNPGNYEHTLYLGAMYRGLDALIPALGYQYRTLKFMLTYDTVMSGLTNASKSNGGLEISLSYTGFFKDRSVLATLACPKF